MASDSSVTARWLAMSHANDPAQYAAGGHPDASCRCCADDARSMTGLIAYAPAPERALS